MECQGVLLACVLVVIMKGDQRFLMKIANGFFLMDFLSD